MPVKLRTEQGNSKRSTKKVETNQSVNFSVDFEGGLILELPAKTVIIFEEPSKERFVVLGEDFSPISRS